MGSLLQLEVDSKQQGPLLAYPQEEGWRACFLPRVRAGVYPRARLEGWLRWFAHLLGGTVCTEGKRSTLLLLQALQK